jgi:cytochrome c553
MRGSTAKAVLAAIAMAGSSQAVLGNERQLALGRHLAQECTSCHASHGGSKAIPSLAGRDAVLLVQALNAYRSGERTNPVMVSVAQSLDDEQIRALALYFASLGTAPESAGKAAATGSARPPAR